MLEPADRFQARFGALCAITNALARPLALVDVLRSIAAELAPVLDVTICFFGLYDAAGQSVNVIWQLHDGVELPGGQFPLGSGFTSQVIRDRQPRLIRDWSQQGPRVQVQYATDRPDLPQSSITVPVIFDDRVLGVLSIQSYQPAAFHHDDLALVQAVADQVALVVARREHPPVSMGGAEARASELEIVIASMSDALVVVDTNARVIRLNQAARTLLCVEDDSLILGWPADEPQGNSWPLGSRTVADAVRPILRQIKRGKAPSAEVTFALPPRTVRCTGSLLLDEATPFGGVLLFREIGPSGTT